MKRNSLSIQKKRENWNFTRQRKWWEDSSYIVSRLAWSFCCYGKLFFFTASKHTCSPSMAWRADTLKGVNKEQRLTINIINQGSRQQRINQFETNRYWDPNKNFLSSLRSVTAQDPRQPWSVAKMGKRVGGPRWSPSLALSNNIAAPFLHLYLGYRRKKA